MFLADDHGHPLRAALIPPLQEIVKDEGMWACHLGPELGGPGYGQMKLALLNYILGRSRCASKVFGTAAPDTGNSEILAHYGTPQQKQQYLAPLLDDQIASSYSMTEPTAGADPKQFKCMAELDELNQEWVINGEKWFSSNAKYASILLVMAVSDPDAPNPYQRASMFIVPKDTPGVEIVRNGSRSSFLVFFFSPSPSEFAAAQSASASSISSTSRSVARTWRVARTGTSATPTSASLPTISSATAAAASSSRRRA